MELNRKERLVAIALTCAMVPFLLLHLVLGIVIDSETTAFQLIPLTGAAFCLASASFLVGRRFALLMFVVAGAGGFVAEYIGVHTGLLFGNYHYGDQLGPKILAVPYTIPVYWFMVIFISYVVSNLIAHDTPAGYGRADLVHVLWLALLGGLVGTAYDLALDPYMASIGAWVWTEPGSDQLYSGGYFGIPLYNFVSWIAVATFISLVLRLAHRAKFFRRTKIENPVSPRTYKLIAAMPVVFYVLWWISYMSGKHVNAEARPVQLISFIALGIPAMAAVSNWRRWRCPLVAPGVAGRDRRRGDRRQGYQPTASGWDGVDRRSA